MAEIAGLKLIVPSSVAGSGVSVSASGKVTFTAATSISVNGVFDSTYDNYLMVVRCDASTTNLGLRARLRLSGTDNTTANSYVDQVLYASSTTVGGARQTSNLWDYFGNVDSAEGGFHCYVYGPALAQPTAYRTVMVSGTSGAYIADGAGTHNQSTSYDGMTFYPSSGSITGACTVYGLSQ